MRHATARLGLIVVLREHVLLKAGGARCPEIAELTVELDAVVEVAHMALEVVGAGGLVLASLAREPEALVGSELVLLQAVGQGGLVVALITRKLQTQMFGYLVSLQVAGLGSLIATVGTQESPLLMLLEHMFLENGWRSSLIGTLSTRIADPLVDGEAMLFETVRRLEAGRAERAGVAHKLMAGLDVVAQISLLLRLKTALVTQEPEPLVFRAHVIGEAGSEAGPEAAEVAGVPLLLQLVAAVYCQAVLLEAVRLGR